MMRSNVIVRLKYLLCFLHIAFLFSSCALQYNYAWLKPGAIIIDSSLTKKYGASPCMDYRNYIPDTLHPLWQPPRYVRVNMHFMLRSDGTGGFPDNDDTRTFIWYLLNSSREKLDNNKRMLLPKGNHNAHPPAGFQFVLSGDTAKKNDDGIYFHKNDTTALLITGGKKRNVESFDAYNRYGRMKGKVINIFFYEYAPDSFKSPTFHLTFDGIGAGNWAKMLGIYESLNEKPVLANGDTMLRGFWCFSGLLNHELGHCLGLSHTWNTNDGCDDTPNNPNCWGCDGACTNTCSNNVMDYNAYQEALSPCQLGKVHLNLSNPKSPTRNYLQPVHCDFHPDATIYIHTGDTVMWSGYKDLWGDVVIEENATLILRCDVSLPNGAKVTLRKGATLICAGGTFYNSCGEQWQGIEIPMRNSHAKIICAPGCAPRDMWFVR